MLPIIDKLIPVSEFTRTGKKLKQVKGIVMHYTASPGATAQNIASYFKRLSEQKDNDDVADRYASAHYAVDSKSIVQMIPDLEMAYHVGSKTYTSAALDRLSKYPNDCTIGIEMCIEKDGSIHEQTFLNAADLTAMLIKKYKLYPASIWTHKEVVGWKDCPLPWIKNPKELERFKKEVQRRL